MRMNRRRMTTWRQVMGWGQEDEWIVCLYSPEKPVRLPDSTPTIKRQYSKRRKSSYRASLLNLTLPPSIKSCPAQWIFSISTYLDWLWLCTWWLGMSKCSTAIRLPEGSGREQINTLEGGVGIIWNLHYGGNRRVSNAICSLCPGYCHCLCWGHAVGHGG